MNLQTQEIMHLYSFYIIDVEDEQTQDRSLAPLLMHLYSFYIIDVEDEQTQDRSLAPLFINDATVNYGDNIGNNISLPKDRQKKLNT